MAIVPQDLALRPPEPVLEFARRFQATSGPIRFSKNKECGSEKKHLEAYSGWLKVDLLAKRIEITIIESSSKPIYKSEKSIVKHAKTFTLDTEMKCLLVEKTALKRTKIIEKFESSVLTFEEGVRVHEELDKAFPGAISQAPHCFPPYKHRSGIMKMESVQKEYPFTLYNCFDEYYSPKGIFERPLQACQYVLIALEKIHKKYIHADIRAENILLEETTDSKLLGLLTDFEFVCSPGWVNEPTDYVYWDSLARKMGIITRFTDIFGMGVTLAELIWGKRVYSFCKRNPSQLRQKLEELVKLHLSERFEYISRRPLKSQNDDKPFVQFYLRTYELVDRIFLINDERLQGRSRDDHLSAAEFANEIGKLLEILEQIPARP